MPTYATPGVYFENVDQSTQGISAVRTDIAAFLGIAAMGPLDQPVPVNTWEQFRSAFGSFLPNGYLAYAAKAFFENGGQKLYVIRIAAPEAKTVTSGPQPLDGSASVVAAVTGFAKGTVVTATQDAYAKTSGAQPADRASSVVDTIIGFPEGTLVRLNQTTPASLQAWRKVRAVDAASKRLIWDSPLDGLFSLAHPIILSAHQEQDLLLADVDPVLAKVFWTNPLRPAFDLTQPISLKTGAETSSGRLYDGGGNPTLRIDASSPGIWGDEIGVSVTHSSFAATATVGSQPAGGPVSLVASITGFPVWSLVRVDQSHPSPVIGYRMVKSIDPVVTLIEWDSPLEPQFDVTKALSFETVEFALTVYVNGAAKEIFTGLSLHPKHPRYVEAVVDSVNIRVKDLKTSPPTTASKLLERLPDPAAPQLVQGMFQLAGGRDGIAALMARDFTGDPASQTKSGLRTLEDVDEVAIVAAPDILIEPSPAVLHAPLPPKPPQPCCGASAIPTLAVPAPPVAIEAAPTFSLDDVYRVQQAMIQHCEMMQFRFAILDSPAFGYPGQRVDSGEVQSWRQRFDTEFAALYFPWVFVRDPLQPGNQVVRRVPPSGHVAGVYADTDLTVGVHKAPANTPVLWAQALTANVTENLQGVMNPIGVDCLRVFPGRGLRVYGARTMSSDPSWRFVNVRRLMSMIERALLLSLQWTVFEPNNVFLQHKVKLAVSSFLEAIWRKGALAGNTAEESYYVKCDGTNNPLAVTQAGQLIVEIGVAPALPAEFVVFRIGRSQDTLEVTEL